MGGIAIVRRRRSSGYAALGHISRRLFTRTGLHRDGRDLRRRRRRAASTTGSRSPGARNLGLTKRTKIVGLLVVAVGFAVPSSLSFTASTRPSRFTRFDVAGHRPGQGRCGSCSAVLLILGVDQRREPDRRARRAGRRVRRCSAFAAFTVIGFWQFRNLDVYQNVHALDLAVVVACDARRLHRLPVVERRAGPDLHGRHRVARHRRRVSPRWRSRTDTALLLPDLGGLFVVETLSVMIQVGVASGCFGRPSACFRMAPMHHHFELRRLARDHA